MTNRQRIETAINTIREIPMPSCEKAYVMRCVAKTNKYGGRPAQEAVRNEILRVMQEQNRPLRVKELQHYFPLFSVQALSAYLRKMTAYRMVKRTEQATGRILVVSYEGWDYNTHHYETKTKEIEETIAYFEVR